MPRKRRIWQPDFYYHVVMRGNNRQVIFHDERDYREFFRTLAYVYDKYNFSLLSYCIMSNHYHLLIQSPKVTLSKIMMLLNKRYSEYYKRKYRYCGHLYEKRFFSQQVNDARGLLEVSRYIHRNPINTSVPIVLNLEDYKYSSYYFYKNNIIPPYPYLNVDILPQCFFYRKQRTIEYLCTYTEMKSETTLVEPILNKNEHPTVFEHRIEYCVKAV